MFLILRGRHAVTPWVVHSPHQAALDILAAQAVCPDDLDLLTGFLFPAGPDALESTVVPHSVVLDLLIGWRELWVEARGGKEHPLKQRCFCGGTY